VATGRRVLHGSRSSDARGVSGLLRSRKEHSRSDIAELRKQAIATARRRFAQRPAVGRVQGIAGRCGALVREGMSAATSVPPFAGRSTRRYRTTNAWSAGSSRPTSSATAANTAGGCAARAISVATRRNAACSSVTGEGTTGPPAEKQSRLTPARGRRSRRKDSFAVRPADSEPGSCHRRRVSPIAPATSRLSV
jgi:hypothetical protein